MKKILLLLVSAILSFNAYGEWTTSFEWGNGDSAYVDLDTIKENDGYVYWWELMNFSVAGFESLMSYRQGDCGLSRVRDLQTVVYTELMGEGDSEYLDAEEWRHPTPNSHVYSMLTLVCDLVERDLEALDYSVLN